MSQAILYDSTQCIGCRMCESACADHWGIPYDEQIGSRELLSEHKLTTITTHGERYNRRLCMHCDEPTCVSVCPVGAFEKTALGPVIYHDDRCIGCRYCMLACPFAVPVYEWSKVLPRVRKCDMCADRLALGRPTACSEICPTGATVTGDRGQMIAEARRRIAENPEQYCERIYGLEEAGGTAVLILAAAPLEEIGLETDLPDAPLPALTWRVLSHVPDVVAVGSVLLGGVYWITHRREEVAAAENDSGAGIKEKKR